MFHTTGLFVIIASTLVVVVTSAIVIVVTCLLFHSIILVCTRVSAHLRLVEKC